MWPMRKRYGAMLPQQAIMVKENRIDTHARVFAVSVRSRRERATSPRTRRLEAWRALQDAAGVGHGVLVQPSFLGSDNSTLLESLRAPGRFSPLAGLNVPEKFGNRGRWSRIARFPHRGAVRRTLS